jgi:hypothetical protein
VAQAPGIAGVLHVIGAIIVLENESSDLVLQSELEVALKD